MALTKVSRGLLSTSIVDNGNATAITIDSSENVGIGTSSPSSYHAPADNLVIGSSGDNGLTIASGTSSGGTICFADGTSGGAQYAGFIDYQHNGDYMRFGTNTGTERMRIESSGRVGIGTSNPAFLLDVNHASDNGLARFTSGDADAYITISDVNSSSAYNRIGVVTHDMYFNTNNTERMRIDASGSVGIGVSSPSTRLEVGGGGGSEAIKVSAGAGWADLRLHSNATNGGSIYFNDGADAGQLFYYHVDDTMRFHTATAERMRIGSSGQVKIANGGSLNFDTTSSGNFDIAYKASDNTFNIINNSSSAAMGFHTSSTERMRIDSSGNLLVGTTDADSGSGNGVKIIPANGGTNKPRVAISTAGYAGEVALSLYSTAVSAWRFYVQANGTISAVNTTITSLSDERVKENIRDLDDGLSKVMQLQPRKFDWKEGKGKNITNDRGFIAQEFEQVFPDLVNEWKDEAPEGEEPYKAVSADLIPTLVKAIQEQQTLIESLTARIAALEE